MLFIIGEIAWKSKAGKTGTMVLFFVLAFGMVGFIAKAVIQKSGESEMSQFDNVSVIKKANVYFDGKCVSHTVLMADGSKKTVGVILPSSLTFNTGVPEIMEGVGGSCRVKLKGESEWKTYAKASPSTCRATPSFEIACDEPYHYVCYFADLINLG